MAYNYIVGKELNNIFYLKLLQICNCFVTSESGFNSEELFRIAFNRKHLSSNMNTTQEEEKEDLKYYVLIFFFFFL